MKLHRSLIILLAILLGALLMFIQQPEVQPDCVQVASDSVHAYYYPEFETALVGWFVEGNELKVVKAQADWQLVSGQGIDAMGHHTRMSGWVRSSYLEQCQ